MKIALLFLLQIVVEEKDGVRVTWDGHAVTIKDGRFTSSEAGKTIARDVKPVFIVTTGSRKGNEWGYVFFDKPASRPTQRHEATLKGDVRVEKGEKRVTVRCTGLAAGPFSGDLLFHFYDGSPLIHIEAAMTLKDDLVAYIYDFVLEGDFATVAWQGEKFVREKPQGDPRPVAVRYRTILGETEGGTLAVFPPPHSWFFPRDFTNNFRFAQVGRGRFGLRQDPDGGGAFVPWFDAPVGKTQRMSAFVLLHAGKAEDALDLVKRYTNGDRFKRLDGRFSFTSHWHSRLAVSELDGKPKAPEFARVFKSMGVDIVHLAEFHGDGHPDDAGALRLKELDAMFEVCRKYSDDDLLILPGEEWNRYLADPAHKDKKEHPGHWMYLFPKPVYLTKGGLPFQDGKVYHVGSADDMAEVLKREKGLAWVAHPRIKASYRTPDAFKDQPFFKEDFFLGAAWKAMPADLSEPRLGRRALDCLDDMNSWGHRKWLLGEVDCFEVDRSHEVYGPMNINYLRIAKRPTKDDWSGVLDALRGGDFFVTTGEVLFHSVERKGDKIVADIEWTFPLATAVVVVEGKANTYSLSETTEFGRKTFEWPAAGKWVRLEVWDIAGNGAFTQPLR